MGWDRESFSRSNVRIVHVVRLRSRNYTFKSTVQVYNYRSPFRRNPPVDVDVRLSYSIIKGPFRECYPFRRNNTEYPIITRCPVHAKCMRATFAFPFIVLQAPPTLCMTRAYIYFKLGGNVIIKRNRNHKLTLF